VYSTSEFRNGLKILFNDAACIIVEFQHVKPGKGGAFIRTRMKNLKTGLILEHTFRSGEKVGKPDLQERNMQFLYASDDEFNFMDMDNYEQVQIGGEMLGDKVGYLGENQEVVMLFHGSEVLGMELPMFIEIPIGETSPGVRGDTASGGSKPATLETGATINVPLFLNEGDVVKVDTRTGEYVERVSNR
jgi:elongation factor P